MDKIQKFFLGILAIGIISYLIFWYLSSPRFQKISSIRTAINTLNKGVSFVYYNLYISPNEIKALSRIKIDDTQRSSYCYYGNSAQLNQDIEFFLLSLNKENKTSAKEVSRLITQITKDLSHVSGKEAAWVCVRAFISTPEYNTTRWHTDGYYYEPYSGERYKVSVALKGPATLFYAIPSELRKSFENLQKDGTEENNFNFQALANLLFKATGKISSAPPYYGALFISGTMESSAVHTVPPITEERLLLTILLGTPGQIKEWENKSRKWDIEAQKKKSTEVPKA